MDLTEQDLLVAGLNKDDYKNLKNKHQGGLNNKKGNIFESHFALYQLATSRDETLKSPRKIEHAEQIKSFIDDYWIDDAKGSEQSFFQLKNVEKPSWTDALEKDFIRQEKVNDAFKINYRLYLVYSNRKKQSALQKNMPSNLGNTEIMFFPSVQNLAQLFHVFPESRKRLEAICAHPEPLPSDLETLAWSIIRFWTEKETDKIELDLFFQQIANANQAAVFLNQPDLKPPTNWLAAKILLDKIPDYTYTVERGFFASCYKNADRFVFPYSVAHPGFAKFLDLILAHQPQRYDELEGYMYDVA